MCQTSCIRLGLWVTIEMCWWILNLVNVFTSKHVSPRCISCKPNLHHSPLKGKTIIFRIVLYVPIHSCIWPRFLIKGRMVYYRLLSGAQSPVYDCIFFNNKAHRTISVSVVWTASWTISAVRILKLLWNSETNGVTPKLTVYYSYHTNRNLTQQASVLRL